MADEADRFLVLALLQVAFLGKDPFHIAMPLPEVYGGNISRGGVCVLKSPSYHIQRGDVPGGAKVTIPCSEGRWGGGAGHLQSIA